MKQLCIKSNDYSGRSAITKLIIGALLSLSSVSAIAGESNANEDSLNSNLYPRIDSIISPIGRTYFDYDDEGGLVITRFSRESVDSAWGNAKTSEYLVSDYPFIETQPTYGILDRFNFSEIGHMLEVYADTYKDEITQYSKSRTGYSIKYGAQQYEYQINEKFDKENRRISAGYSGGVYFHGPDMSYGYSYNQSGYMSSYTETSIEAYGERTTSYDFEYNQYGLVEQCSIVYKRNESDNYATDTTVSNYYYSLHSNKYFHIDADAFMTSLTVNSTRVDTFVQGKFEYDFSDFYYLEVNYDLSEGATSKKSYDYETNILTVTVTSKDKKNSHTYHLKFKPYESFLTSLTVNGAKVDTFAQDKFEYDFSDIYYNKNLVSWKTSMEASAKSNYDIETNILTITSNSKDHQNSHQYRLRFKPYESYMTSLSIDGIKVDTFSSNKYNYTLQCDYNEGTFVYELSDETKVVEKVYDPETKTLTLVLQNTNNQSIQSTYTFRFNPIDGLPVVWGESVQLYVDGSTICVNDVNETVNVYDCSGILVGSDTNEQARVTVRKAGVYLVAAKGQAVKVVVK